MQMLVNQFDLKPGIDRSQFDHAWDAFGTALLGAGLAAQISPPMQRLPLSGYDTDESRSHALLALIHFDSPTQAQAAWDAITDHHPGIVRPHAAVIALVRDAVFTFWEDTPKAES